MDEDLIVRLQREIRRVASDYAAAPDRPLEEPVIEILITSPQDVPALVEEGLVRMVRTLWQQAGLAWQPRVRVQDGIRLSVEVKPPDALVTIQDDLDPYLEVVFPMGDGSRWTVRANLENGRPHRLGRGVESDLECDSVELGTPLLSDHLSILEVCRTDDEIHCRVPFTPGRSLSARALDEQGHEVEVPVRDWGILVADRTAGSVRGRIEFFGAGQGYGSVVLEYAIVAPDRSVAPRFAHVTRDRVVITHQTVSSGGMGYFLKSYECFTIDDAQKLTGHFREQRRLVQELVNTDGDVPAFESTEVWQGEIPAMATIAADRPGRPAESGATTRAEAPSWDHSPAVQPDHRVFVRTPLLTAVTWEAGSSDRLNLLKPLAAALDRAHLSRLAHCDVKPANVCIAVRREPLKPIARQWAVLVDTEALTGGVCDYTGLRTPRYVHPDFERKRKSGLIRALIANDRYGFVAVVLAALFGTEVSDHVLQTSSTQLRTEVIIAALQQDRLEPGASPVLLAPLTTCLADLIEDGSTWTCEGWLDEVLVALRQPVDLAGVGLVPGGTTGPEAMHPVKEDLLRLWRSVRGTDPDPVQVRQWYRMLLIRRAWRQLRIALAWTITACTALALFMIWMSVGRGK